MKKWILFGLSLLALTASLALSACGTQEQGGETTGTNQTTPSGEGTTGAPATPESGGTGGTGTTEGGQTGGTGTTEGGQTGGTGGGQ